MDPLVDSSLVRLQRAVAALLRQDGWFMDRPVLTEDVDDIDSELQKAIAPLDETKGKLGTAALVMTASGNVGSANTPGPVLDQVTVNVWIFEQVLMNRSEKGGKIPALALAERAARYLHLRKIPLDGAGALIARSIRLEEPPAELASCIAFRVELRTKLGLAPINEGR